MKHKMQCSMRHDHCPRMIKKRKTAPLNGVNGICSYVYTELCPLWTQGFDRFVNIALSIGLLYRA